VKDLFIPARLYAVEDWSLRIGPYDLTEYCKTDARAFGVLVEQVLLQEFSNLDRPPRGQKSADLIESNRDGFRIWEVKTARKNVVNIQQSHAKGVGRKHDAVRFARYLNSIHGIIVVDLRRLPVVFFGGIPVSEITSRFGTDPKNIPTDIIYEVGKACDTPTSA
jgi:hypothetical protein